MASELKGVKDLEEELGVKLTKKEEKKDGTAIVFEVKGKKYNTIRQNLVDDVITWLKTRKGWRALLLYVMIAVSFIFIAKDAPVFLGFIFIFPFIYIGAEILAYFINKGKKRPILQLSIARKAVPVSLVTDADGKEVKVMTFRPEITGWDMHYVYDEAISDSNHPIGVTIPDMVTIPHLRTKEKLGIIEYKSSDGKFARGSPFRTLNNYYILNAFTKPKVIMNKDYMDFMNKLKDIPGMAPEDIKEIKDMEEEFHKRIGDLAIFSNTYRRLLQSHGAKLRNIANIKMDKHELLTQMDMSSMPILKHAIEDLTSGKRGITEVLDLLNEADETLKVGSDLTMLMPELRYQARQEERANRAKLREPDIKATLMALQVDMKVSGAPKSPDIIKEAEEAYEEDEEDGDN